ASAPRSGLASTHRCKGLACGSGSRSGSRWSPCCCFSAGCGGSGFASSPPEKILPKAVDGPLRGNHMPAAGTLIRGVPSRYHHSLEEVINMAFRPLHDRVLVRRIEAEEKTAGGIIIPDNAKEKPSEGEVIAVGEGAYNEDGDRIKPDVKAGDRVLFGKWSGTEVKLDGEDLLIMKESDIMGIIG